MITFDITLPADYETVSGQSAVILEFTVNVGLPADVEAYLLSLDNHKNDEAAATAGDTKPFYFLADQSDVAAEGLFKKRLDL